VVDEVPRPVVAHRTIRCPWSRKGAVMRVLTERTKERETDTLDGLKVFVDGGWAQVLPDSAEPVVHVYAEGKTEDDTRRLEEEFTLLVESIIQDDDA
jgi:mannose-1-phosphate guanylyltransferase/phosphomannomutase